MGISGCTSCQLGSVQALNAYDRAREVKQAEVSANNTNDKPRPKPSIYENRPVASGAVGSIINISA